MVLAYWLIGREIVMELQRGKERAGYGDRVVQDLSIRLTEVFGKGYSVENLWKFKMFYLAYAPDLKILSTSWTESAAVSPGPSLESAKTSFPEFSDRLTWSHYRALMRVDRIDARAYYEREAASGNWTVRELERQIHARGYERLIATQLRRGCKSRSDNPPAASWPDVTSDALLASASVRLYVDLVLYSIPLRCYLLIDLKTGKLTHADVGQMDGYVRMFDDLMAGPEDNPTIGLILCTEHNSAVARYSVLNDRRQIFASRYVTCLPTEAELAAEIQRTRELLEGQEGRLCDQGSGKP